MTEHTAAQIYQGNINRLVLKEKNRQIMTVYFRDFFNKDSFLEYVTFLGQNNKDEELYSIIKMIEKYEFIYDPSIYKEFIDNCLSITHDFGPWYPSENNPMKIWAQEFHSFMRSSVDLQNIQIDRLLARIDSQNEEIRRLITLVSNLHRVEVRPRENIHEEERSKKDTHEEEKSDEEKSDEDSHKITDSVDSVDFSSFSLGSKNSISHHEIPKEKRQKRVKVRKAVI